MEQGIKLLDNHGVEQFIACEPGTVSDGYHTFDELYKHRCLLFCLLLAEVDGWKSLCHDDSSLVYEGWFIAGTELSSGSITYHLPISMWDMCKVPILAKAPPFDGHTSNEVIDRMEAHLNGRL